MTTIFLYLCDSVSLVSRITFGPRCVAQSLQAANNAEHPREPTREKLGEIHSSGNENGGTESVLGVQKERQGLRFEALLHRTEAAGSDPFRLSAAVDLDIRAEVLHLARRGAIVEVGVAHGYVVVTVGPRGCSLGETDALCCVEEIGRIHLEIGILVLVVGKREAGLHEESAPPEACAGDKEPVVVHQRGNNG